MYHNNILAEGEGVTVLPTLKFFNSGQQSRIAFDPTLYAFPDEAMDNLGRLVDGKLNRSMFDVVNHQTKNEVGFFINKQITDLKCDIFSSPV